MKIFVDYEQIIETCFHHLWLAQTTFILFQIIIICKKKNQTIIFPFVSKKQNLFYLILVVIVVLITRRYDDTYFVGEYIVPFLFYCVYHFYLFILILCC